MLAYIDDASSTVIAYTDDTALAADLERVVIADRLTFIARFVDGRVLLNGSNRHPPEVVSYATTVHFGQAVMAMTGVGSENE
jgi:hypothetical protein